MNVVACVKSLVVYFHKQLPEVPQFGQDLWRCCPGVTKTKLVSRAAARSHLDYRHEFAASLIEEIVKWIEETKSLLFLNSLISICKLELPSNILKFNRITVQTLWPAALYRKIRHVPIFPFPEMHYNCC